MNWQKKRYKKMLKKSKSIMKQKENLKELNNLVRLLKTKKEVIHLKIRTE